VERPRRRSGESGTRGTRSELKETKEKKDKQQDSATIFTDDIEIKQQG
jgi:hypothetical protein